MESYGYVSLEENMMYNMATVPSSLAGKFWLVAADMGYGHHRAIYPLKSLGKSENIINANTSKYASAGEIRLWRNMQRTYEFMSRASKLPVFGKMIAKILNSLLYIPEYYPFIDRSAPTYQVHYLKSMIKRGLCRGIIIETSEPRLPLITSFYSSAIAAETAGFDKVYCIICDTDLNRAWVPEYPSKSNIIYFAPGTIADRRLLSYGVQEQNILITGFPLPIELLGDRNLDVLKRNLCRRLKNLDPSGKFYNIYKYIVNVFLPCNELMINGKESNDRCVSLTFVVGGAGAQKEIGRSIVRSLSDKIKRGEIKVNLVAGTRPDIRDYFEKVKIEFVGMNENVNVIWASENETYFDLFNQCLHSTDILWTKPSELSFYCGLGIPVIISPAIGPQEKCNRRWLREIGAGLKMRDPNYTDQWLTELLEKGTLAEAAWLGFLKVRKLGTYNILDFLEKGSFATSNNPLKR